jgi:hypothetical protein
VVLLNYLLPQKALGLLMAGGGDAAAELDHDLHGAPEVPRRPARKGANRSLKRCWRPPATILYRLSGADSGADVHHRRDAPVGDLLPVWILFLFIAFKPCAVRRSEIARRPAGLISFYCDPLRA